jgi:hypothetical protein
MKKLNLLIILLMAGIAFNSCKKPTNTLQLDGGSINVTNAVVETNALSMMSANAVVGSNNSVSPNNYAILPVQSGQSTLNFGLPAVPATETTTAIPAVIYYTQSLAMTNKGNYSLFLTGSSLSALDHVLINETYTPKYTDSVCGVRFINLATGSEPITVNLKGASNGSEAANLAYKAYSDFKQYPAKRANAKYTFEFRDASTGILIATYNLPTPYFHNVTLCLNGDASGIILDKDF